MPRIAGVNRKLKPRGFFMPRSDHVGSVRATDAEP
jgi:hypothetical protein